MENLTNIIEAILFASGKAVAFADIAEKLNVTSREISRALDELREKYGETGGIQLLEFNKKAQLASNPVYKESVAAVLNPIREKELTRTILECAAIIAYKQPITRTEIEFFRGVNSDYAVNMLLDLKLIYPCGRKDAVGRPVLFATTDEFLKRFKLKSLDELPDYNVLLAKISSEAERDSYLYARRDEEGTVTEEKPQIGEPQEEEKPMEEIAAEGGYELPDFLREIDGEELVKIS